MKLLSLAALTLTAAPLFAVQAGSLPGVSDQETRIAYGDIQDFQRGNGDVMFVRDRMGQWYRVGLNDGCLDKPLRANRVEFRTRGIGNTIDRFTQVILPDDLRSCGIDSIRRSEAPPQVDSKSPVTLD